LAYTNTSTPRIQPRAMAFRALAADHERREPCAESLAVGVAKTLLEICDYPSKRHCLCLAHPAELEGELPLPRPEQDRAPGFLRQVFPRHIRIERQLLRELLEQRVVFDDEIFSANAPRLQRAFADRL